MDFEPNINSVEVIKKGAFGGIGELEGIDKKCYASDFYDVSVNKNSAKCGTSLRLFEKTVGLMGLIHVGGFNGILDIGKEEDLKMIKDKLVDEKELLVDLKIF